MTTGGVTMAFPKGNAQVGDTAWYRERRDQDWIPGWSVVAVGLTNSAGYPLDIEVRHPIRGSKQVSPFLPSGLMQRPEVFIRPHNPPQKLVDRIAEYQDLVLVRDGGNHDYDRFQLLCTRCMTPVFSAVVEMETAELTVAADGVIHESELDLENSHTDYRCNCQDLDGSWFTYELGEVERS